MRAIYSNATAHWTEREILEREALIQTIPALLKEVWVSTNSAISFFRVETPILTPATFLQSHIKQKFELLETSRGYLRPETTAGTIEAFQQMFPQKTQRAKKLPICIWQVGKSFRDEKKGDTMRATKLRLREFWQLEFQLFTAVNTKTDYLSLALEALTHRFGGTFSAPIDVLPHYSRRTLDWHLMGLEVAGCSERTDWPERTIFEVAIGLDRLVTLLLANQSRQVE